MVAYMLRDRQDWSIYPQFTPPLDSTTEGFALDVPTPVGNDVPPVLNMTRSCWTRSGLTSGEGGRNIGGFSDTVVVAWSDKDTKETKQQHAGKCQTEQDHGDVQEEGRPAAPGVGTAQWRIPLSSFHSNRIE